MRADAAPSFLYLPELPEPGAAVALSAPDLHYLLRVVRARSGDTCTASDGRGTVATLALEVTARRVRAVVATRELRPPGPAATVLCGAPEGERADWLVEKLAELCVTVWQPVDCARAAWRRRGVARWERLAIAALRQSQSAWRMEVRAPLPLAAAARVVDTSSRWLADPGGARYVGARAGPEVVAVGPAGGFTAGESVELERSGFIPIRLAANRLRTETAALAWASQWAGSPSSASGGPQS